ncbi:MAG: hypothetical protein HZB83_01390 [Deltaproteobacteria bacterium]|nr:hypothetical protein [Deltaproteobacteria bacterium]
MPLGVYLSYGTAKKSAAGETANLLNAGSNDRSAWTLTGELGVMPGRLALSAGYRAGKQGNTANDDDNAFLIGASYLVTQNVQLQLNRSWYTGSAFDTPQATGDSLTTLMVFAAF